jgi:2-iminobutanoate/2-iminopropanoate deaminase
LLLTLALGSPLLSQKENKKALGADMVPAGTLYSPGVLIGDTLYISGLQGTDQQTHKLPQDFGQEVKNCLDNVGLVLKEGGMGYEDVVSVQIYLVDISQFQQVNDIYKRYFRNSLPTRTTVQVTKLTLGVAHRSRQLQRSSSIMWNAESVR